MDWVTHNCVVEDLDLLKGITIYVVSTNQFKIPYNSKANALELLEYDEELCLHCLVLMSINGS